MTLNTFSSGVNTSFSTELNSNFDYSKQLVEASLSLNGKNLIRQMHDGARKFSLAQDDVWGDAYSSINGRNNSVSSQSVLFDTDKFKYQTTLDGDFVVKTGNYWECGFEVVVPSGNFSSIVVGSGGNNVTKDIGIYLNTVLQETVSSVSFPLSGDATITLATPLAVVGGDIIKLKNEDDTTNVFEMTNAHTLRNDYMSYSSGSGTYHPGSEGNGVITFTGVPLGEILMEVPSGTYSSTITSCIGIPMIEDWETGADIQYKLLGSGEDSGWLTCGNTPEISTFTAFATQPTSILIKLIPKTSSPTAGYPSINGFVVKEI